MFENNNLEEYLNASSNAKKHGGPEKYKKSIHDEGFKEGYDAGKIEGYKTSFIIVIIGCISVILYRIFKEPFIRFKNKIKSWLNNLIHKKSC